jgi:hypothetical protein
MMNAHFEIKYLALKWYNQETILKVTESLNTLRLEYDANRALFKAETTIYPKLDDVKGGQLAIRFLHETADAPYIVMPNGKKNYLSQIKDPDTGIVWWVVKNRWSHEQNQWLGIAHNVAGTIRFFLQSQICEIVINGSDFTHEQLEQYLRIFKNDLWELILDESSPIQAEAK